MPLYLVIKQTDPVFDKVVLEVGTVLKRCLTRRADVFVRMQPTNVDGLVEYVEDNNTPAYHIADDCIARIVRVYMNGCVIPLRKDGVAVPLAKDGLQDLDDDDQLVHYTKFDSDSCLEDWLQN